MCFDLSLIGLPGVPSVFTGAGVLFDKAYTGSKLRFLSFFFVRLNTSLSNLQVECKRPYMPKILRYGYVPHLMSFYKVIGTSAYSFFLQKQQSKWLESCVIRFLVIPSAVFVLICRTQQKQNVIK